PQPAKPDQQNRADQQIRVEHPQDLVERGMQGGDDARDRDIHDRGVEQDHEEPEAEEDQYQPRVRARLDGLRWGCHETSCDLTEREAVGLDARIEEFDLEGSILNAAPL